MRVPDLAVLAHFTDRSADEVIADINTCGAKKLLPAIEKAFGDNDPIDVPVPDGIRFYGKRGWVIIWNRQKHVACFARRKA